MNVLKKTPWQGFPWKLYSQLIALPQGNCANRQTFQAITRNCENSNTQCGCLWCCGKTAQKNTKLKISDTDWKQILSQCSSIPCCTKAREVLGNLCINSQEISQGERLIYFLSPIPNFHTIFNVCFQRNLSGKLARLEVCRSTDIFLTHHSQSSLVKLLELFTH